VTASLIRSKINYLSLDEATTPPGNGTWDVYVDRWWCFKLGKGLLFYGKSPQCNPNESISRKVQEKCHPDAELIFVPRAYVRHNCQDYM
jgi:hypothetical protein